MNKVNYPCPCCENIISSEYGEGSYEICDYCCWEDCGVRELDQHSGPNHMTLREFREAFNKLKKERMSI